MKSLKQLITEARNKKLIKNYPFLMVRNVWTGEPGENPYQFTWLDQLPDGWRKAFGLNLCEELKQELLKYNYLDDYRLCQVKQKYGTLRWYDNGFPSGSAIPEIINKYEDFSMCYCPVCGKPTKYYTKGWISYLCEDCTKKEIAGGANEANFIRLNAKDAPVRSKLENNKMVEVPLDDEVQKLINENWEN